MSLLPSTRGFSLIEVLVALFVLSVGLLGTAQLQIVSLRYGNESFQRSQAVALAYDMADRMRANEFGLANGNYNSAPANANYAAPLDGACADTKSTAASSCNSNAMSAHDAFEWGGVIAQTLPGAGGTVCVDSDPNDAVPCDNVGDVHSIVVTWAETLNGQPVTKNYTLRFVR